jgi:phenylalanyl-tRNA synthetase beta chain
MKVSLSWLKTFIPIEMGARELADALTMAGLEVDALIDRYAYLDSVFVGRITAIKNHPNADRLKICDVDIKNRGLSIICGAPNVQQGMLAPVALPGTRFPNNMVLEKGIIRGIASDGMLCSEAELELGLDASGIMILKDDLTVGENLAKALQLSDVTIEMDLTPNRPDCLSIIGTAREIGAIQKKQIAYPDITLHDSREDIREITSVTVEAPDLCPRYAARVVENVTVAPSPFWLQNRLRSVGLRPINNIVDITNFVLMEYGQPLHAFDFDRLAENRIVVRAAVEGEPFTTLDEKERLLPKDTLLICDGEKPVAIAGIMGGLNSEIEASTTRVLIESAYFNPASIRKTSKQLGLNTDASHRFERGIDPLITLTALDRAAQLMVETGGGTLVQGIVDVCNHLPEPATIILSVQETNRLLGTNFNRNDIQEFLSSIEFRTDAGESGTLSVTPPSYRVDIKRPEDLMEEVARLSGYDRIPTTSPLIPADIRKSVKLIDKRARIQKIMTGFGFTEAVNYSFMDKSDCDRLNLAPGDPKRNLLEILNPLTEDQTVMRSSLMPGLIGSIRKNLSQQVKNCKLFEIGKIFIDQGKSSLPEEIEILSGIWTGARIDPLWNIKEEPCDFFDIKGVVEGFLAALKVDNIQYTTLPDDQCRYVRPGFSAQIMRDREQYGIMGELHPHVLRNFDLKQTVFIFEINLSRLYSIIPETKQAGPIPKYPFVTRDITVIIDKDIEANSLLDFVREMNYKLVEQLHLFDMFTGKPITAGKKSISFRVIYRSHEETLEDEIVNRLHKEISDKLVIEFNAALPEVG